MGEYRDALDRADMLRSEDKIRIAFGVMGHEDHVCHAALSMAMHDNYPLAAGLFIALEHIKKERDHLRALHLDYVGRTPSPAFKAI